MNDIQLIENEIKLNGYDRQTIEHLAVSAAEIFNKFAAECRQAGAAHSGQLVQNLSAAIRTLSAENDQLKRQLQEVRFQTGRDLQQYCDQIEQLKLIIAQLKSEFT